LENWKIEKLQVGRLEDLVAEVLEATVKKVEI
jgi:hypothetical protein